MKMSSMIIDRIFKKILFTILFIVGIFLFFYLIPNVVSAHEVYVLDSETVQEALKQPPLQVFSIIYAETGRFFFWFFFVLILLTFVGIASFSKRLEALFDPALIKLRVYAPFIGRVTLGISLIASAYFGAMFGPEIPIDTFIMSPVLVSILRIFLAVAGILLTIGLFTRITALLMMFTYGAMIIKFNLYMLTYINYFGEMIIAFTLGGSVLAIDKFFKEYVPSIFKPLVNFVTEHGFFILRLAFGISLIYAAVYAKFFHAQLAIDTVVQYHLTDYLHFTPSFLVLGAFAVELLLGILFILGIEVRFAAIFLIIFLTMSLVYFGEAVWPHIILVGGALTIFAQGYGKFTLERSYLNHLHKDNQSEEPVF